MGTDWQAVYRAQEHALLFMECCLALTAFVVILFAVATMIRYPIENHKHEED